MARTWVSVTEEKAREHKLYGVGGWLGLFLFGIVMAVARDLGAINTIAIEARTTISGLLAMNHPVADFLRVVVWWDVGAAVLVVLMAITKAGSFRVMTTTVLVLGFPVAAAAAGASGAWRMVGESLAAVFFTWVFGVLIWGTYLQRSKRVRVTFEKQVLDTDPILADAAIVKPSITQAAAATALSAAGSVGALATKAAGVVSAGAGALVASAAESAARVNRNAGAPSPSAAASPVPAATSHAELSPVAALSDEIRERIWAVVMKEYEGPGRRPGLYAEAFAAAEGDETKTKVAYLKRRVKELETTSIAAAQAQAREAAQAAAPTRESAPALTPAPSLAPRREVEAEPRVRPAPGLPLGPFVG